MRLVKLQLKAVDFPTLIYGISKKLDEKKFIE